MTKSYTKYYQELNELQQRAVDHTDGPLLIIAGPGTGKTQLLSVRAASIIENKGVSPENILIITFTNAAAKAMKERLAEILGGRGYDVEVSTFHSFANSIILESEEASSYVGDKIQLEDIEALKVLEYALDNTKGVGDIRPFGSPYYYVKEISKRIGELKRDGISPSEFRNRIKDKKALGGRCSEEKYAKRLDALAAVYEAYEDLKKGRSSEILDSRGRYDYDDMILFASQILRKEKALRDRYADTYRYIMVDEYQDTNDSQLDLLLSFLDKKEPNLCCVGDDDQSIFRFQGASVGNFRKIVSRFPNTKIVALKKNYRSDKELIDASARVISLIPENERMEAKALEAVTKYKEKEIEFAELTTEDDELLYLVRKIEYLKDKIAFDKSLSDEERSRPYNNIAVLVRKRSDITAVVDALLRSGIPYATDGKEDISGERRVKQLLDVLDLAATDLSDIEKKDLSLYKVLSADYAEIPQPDILNIIKFANTENQDTNKRRPSILRSFLVMPIHKGSALKLIAPDKLARIQKAITHLLEDAETRSLHTILMDFIKDSGMFSFILKEFESSDILRIRELRAATSFVNMVKRKDLTRPSIRLDEFMDELKTMKEHGIPIQGSLVTLTQDGVRVYTTHGAKGLEFHAVIIPFCVQNRSWPLRPRADLIPLPPEIFSSREKSAGIDDLKKLNMNDETRLFYVAMTRARSHLIFTASPSEGQISSPFISRLCGSAGQPKPEPEESTLRAFMSSTDKNDPFIGTDKILSDLIDNLTLNPTRLNTYLECKRKFLYNDVLKLPGAKKRSLVFGNCVHKACEETYKEFKATRKFPTFRFFKAAFDSALTYQGVDKLMRAQCAGDEQMAKLRRWFDHISRDPVIPVDLEKKLIITVGDGIIFTGKYDKVEQADATGKSVRIVDYKTGKPDDHIKAIESVDDVKNEECDGYLRQLVAYRMLYERGAKGAGPNNVKCGTLIFTEPLGADIRKLGLKKGDFVEKTVAIRDDMVVSLEELIVSSWRSIRSLDFKKLPDRDEKKCGRCDFDSICWG